MTDDEVKLWLGVGEYDERALWDLAGTHASAPDREETALYARAVLSALRTLAETRRMYARLCSRTGIASADDPAWSPSFASEHEAFFTAMPRPKLPQPDW